MKAYLQSTGHTWVMEIAKPDPIDSKSTDAQIARYIRWTKANDSIVGSVNMHLSDALCQRFESKVLAAELLKALDEEFATVGITAAYALFKELLDLCIPDSFHPLPAFSKVETLFSRLKAAGYEFNEKCQAVMLLAKLPPSMDIIAQTFTQAKDTSGKPKDPSVAEIPRLLSCHGTSTTSPEKGSSRHRQTRSVLSSTRGSRTLHSSSSSSSSKGNSPSRVLMQALRRRNHAMARRVRASRKTMLISPLLHFSLQ